MSLSTTKNKRVQVVTVSLSWPWNFREGRKHGALRPQKPLRLVRDGEVGGREFLYLTPTRYTVTTRMTLHEGGQLCEPF